MPQLPPSAKLPAPHGARSLFSLLSCRRPPNIVRVSPCENCAPRPTLHQEILIFSEKVIECHIANQHFGSNDKHGAVCGSRPLIGTQIENYILKIIRGFNSRQIRLFGFNVQAEPHAARWLIYCSNSFEEAFV